MIGFFESHPKSIKSGCFQPGMGGYGSIFWARCSYLLSCRKPSLTTRRHSYEDWLGSHGHSFYDDSFSLYGHQSDVYFLPEMHVNI